MIEVLECRAFFSVNKVERAVYNLKAIEIVIGCDAIVDSLEVKTKTWAT